MSKKLKYSKIKIGSKVKWNDPAIEDYDMRERKKMLNRIFKVMSIQGESNVKCTEEDDIVLISDGYSEAEVYARELVVC